MCNTAIWFVIDIHSDPHRPWLYFSGLWGQLTMILDLNPPILDDELWASKGGRSLPAWLAPMTNYEPEGGHSLPAWLASRSKDELWASSFSDTSNDELWATSMRLPTKSISAGHVTVLTNQKPVRQRCHWCQEVLAHNSSLGLARQEVSALLLAHNSSLGLARQEVSTLLC